MPALAWRRMIQIHNLFTFLLTQVLFLGIRRHDEGVLRLRAIVEV